MRKSCLLLVLALLAAVPLGGCAPTARRARDTNVQSLVADYDNTWKAMYDVMARHFLVEHSSRSEGVIDAVEVRNDGRQGQAETRVSAKIFPSSRGGYDIEVRARNYVELSEPVAFSSKTPRYEWNCVGFDSKLETQLRNEIDAVRFQGKAPRYENAFLQSPREEIPVP